MIRVLVEKVGRTWDVVELRPDRRRANIAMRVRQRAAAERYAHMARMKTWAPTPARSRPIARWAAGLALLVGLGGCRAEAPAPDPAAEQAAAYAYLEASALVVNPVGHAQRYSLRRTTILAPTLPYPFKGGYQLFEIVEAAAVTCDLERGAPSAPGFRIYDRVNEGRDCEWIAPADLPIFTFAKNATYAWEIAQQFDGEWSDPVPPEYRGPEPTLPQNVKIRTQ